LVFAVVVVFFRSETLCAPWNLQKFKEIDEKFSLLFFGTFFGTFFWFFFVFLGFPKNECISSKTKAIYPKFFQERVHVLKIQMLFFIHTVFLFYHGWVCQDSLIRSLRTFLGGKLNENILKLKKNI